MTETERVPVSSLATALAKAQGEMENARINRNNPYFNSRYADLAAIRDATVPALSKNGLCIYHSVYRDGETWLVRAVLKHGETGESIISEFPLPNMFDKPQAVGSAITYAKRYTWAALCGISAEEDDDANAVHDQSAPPPRKPQAKPDVIEPRPETKLISATPVAIVDAPGDNWAGWGKQFLDHIKQSKAAEEADLWMGLNGQMLDKMKAESPKIHKRLSEALFNDVYSKLVEK